MDHARAIELIQAAPFEDDGWATILEATNWALGAWGGQLLGLGPDGALMFDICSGVDEAIIAEFEVRFDPSEYVNPRARVLRAAPGRVLGDDDCLPIEQRARNPFYADFYDKVQAPFVGLAWLPGRMETQIVLSGFRDRNLGHIDTIDRERLDSLLPYVANAARILQSLERATTNMVARTLDAIAAPAFLLNAWGVVVGMNWRAEHAAARGEVVTVAARRLRATSPASHARLQRAIDQALGWAAGRRTDPGASSVLLSGGDQAVVAEVSPLPRGRLTTGGDPAAIVALPPPARSRETALRLLQQGYGLTPAEAEVTLSVSRGRPLTDIAAARGVQVQTIKNQLKAIFQKLGVRSQAELAHVATQLLGLTD